MFTVQGFGNKKWSAIWAIRQHPKNRSKKTGPAQSNHTLYRISIYLSLYIYMGYPYIYGVFIWYLCGNKWYLGFVGCMYIYMGFRWVYMGNTQNIIVMVYMDKTKHNIWGLV